MHIGILQFTFQIPHAASLKDKRSVVRSMKDRLRQRFNISIAEVDDHDQMTVGTLGAAMVGTDVRYINGALDKIVDALEEWRDAVLDDHQIEILNPNP
ncbi:MAG: DUF503 domain-containing protein [Planctomycetes bacterium]|nr:DUF503 domain-containing protein [Planctomycetota bacterium]